MVRVTIERAYLPEGTFSKVTLPNGRVLAGLEPPWNGNQTNISCIPEGLYLGVLEESPIVERLSKGAYKKGWKLQSVVGRSHIVVHVGNVINDTQGCLLVGMKRGSVLGQMGVLESGRAFEIFMDALKKETVVEFWFKPWQVYK